jgi:hypothetical protein
MVVGSKRPRFQIVGNIDPPFAPASFRSLSADTYLL